MLEAENEVTVAVLLGLNPVFRPAATSGSCSLPRRSEYCAPGVGILTAYPQPVFSINKPTLNFNEPFCLPPPFHHLTKTNLQKNK